MVLDEAIIHAREVAERNRRQYKNCPANRKDIEHQTCEQCAEEHEQLVEWLEDYKRLKSIPGHTYANCHNVTCRRRCEKDGYDKAIDDIEEMIENIDWYHIHNGNLVHGANSSEHEPLYKHSDIKKAFGKIRGSE